MQALPAQQASPAPPHWTQTSLVLQALPVEHARFAQHAWPAPPQAWQVGLAPPVHAVLGAVQVVLLQHGWFVPPQVPQLPFAHMPPTVGQVLPLPVQTLATQQPPLAQVLPGQQAWPGAPQAVQTPFWAPVQTSPAVHVRPAQQI